MKSYYVPVTLLALFIALIGFNKLIIEFPVITIIALAAIIGVILLIKGLMTKQK